LRGRLKHKLISIKPSTRINPIWNSNETPDQAAVWRIGSRRPGVFYNGLTIKRSSLSLKRRRPAGGIAILATRQRIRSFKARPLSFAVPTIDLLDELAAVAAAIRGVIEGD
jgi:hypothetical protein